MAPSRLKHWLLETRSISPLQPKYRLRFGTGSIAEAGPVLQLANLAQEEIPTHRILQARRPSSTHEMANPGAADPSAIDEEKAVRAAADTEKADRDKEIASDERDSAQVYRMRVEKAQLPDRVRKAALREVGELERTSELSPDSSAIRAWLDTILDLPWNTMTLDSIVGQREVDSAAPDRKKADTEKVYPAATNRKMVYRKKVDPTRRPEIVWPLPPWAADIEMVRRGKG